MEWCIRELSCSSIISPNITSITHHDQYTDDIYPRTFFPYIIYYLYLIHTQTGESGPGFITVVLGAALVVGGYGIGYGPIPWVLSSEMVPVAVRGTVMAASLVAQNTALLVTNLVYVTPKMLL